MKTLNKWEMVKRAEVNKLVFCFFYVILQIITVFDVYKMCSC